jgi:hypothetical protein
MVTQTATTMVGAAKFAKQLGQTALPATRPSDGELSQPPRALS